MPIRISVRVSPGARRTEVVGRHGGGWRVRVAAPPERGRANEALIEHLANVLGVPRGAVRIVAGPSSRDKIVEIDGLSAAEVEAALCNGAWTGAAPRRSAGPSPAVEKPGGHPDACTSTRLLIGRYAP
jgi:uncharacterized protein (TIGR00251 family)